MVGVTMECRPLLVSPLSSHDHEGTKPQQLEKLAEVPDKEAVLFMVRHGPTAWARLMTPLRPTRAESSTDTRGILGQPVAWLNFSVKVGG
jgi:hypothetical protein